MADSWIRLDTKAAFGGWTGKLSPERYAAFVKLLQTIKAFGERGGRIRTSFLDDDLLAQLRLTRNAFDQMISSGKKHGKIQLTDDGYIVITDWYQYQYDPTHAARQQRYRDRRVTEVTVTDECDGRDDDGTGRDGTGRDVNSAPATQASDEPSKTSPPKGGTETQTPGAGSTEAPPRQPSRKRKKKPDPNHQPLTDYFCVAWKAQVAPDDNEYPHEGGKDAKAVQAILRAAKGDLSIAKGFVDAYLELKGWPAEHGHKLSLMPGCLAELITGSQNHDQNQRGNQSSGRRPGDLR